MDHRRDEKESVGHVARKIISYEIVGCITLRTNVLSRKTGKSRVRGVRPDGKRRHLTESVEWTGTCTKKRWTLCGRKGRR